MLSGYFSSLPIVIQHCGRLWGKIQSLLSNLRHLSSACWYWPIVGLTNDGGLGEIVNASGLIVFLLHHLCKGNFQPPSTSWKWMATVTYTATFSLGPLANNRAVPCSLCGSAARSWSHRCSRCWESILVDPRGAPPQKKKEQKFWPHRHNHDDCHDH